jgi:hypothetical protein
MAIWSSCGNFNIQITNLSKVSCILINQDVSHGNTISAPPGSIMPTESKAFDMRQTEFYGPSIKLSYQCDKEIVIFNSQQNNCFLGAGDIMGSVSNILSSTIIATYTASEGEWWWSTPGKINWTISGKT